MEVSSPEVLIGLMAVMGLTAIGLTVWLIRYILRGQRKKKPAKAPSPPPSQDEATELASAAIPDAAPHPVVEPPEPTHTTPFIPPAAQGREPVSEPGDILLMRVWQDRDGYLVVEVEGQRYRRLFDIRDRKIGPQVLETINRLVAFSKGQESRVAPPPPSKKPVPSPAIASPLPDAIAEEQSQAFLEQLQQQAEAKPQKPRISMDPMPFRRRSEVKERLITLNLADEIDQLLQVRVRASPEFSQRYIHVANAPDGGLRFEVDGVHYGGLEEIPDPQVQALIREAIAEWEARR
jgi:hypothetical protein